MAKNRQARKAAAQRQAEQNVARAANAIEHLDEAARQLSKARAELAKIPFAGLAGADIVPALEDAIVLAVVRVAALGDVL
jgi:hypothetical protein